MKMCFSILHQINDKHNKTLLHGRIQDIGGGGGAWPLFVYRSDTNNAYYYQKFYILQSMDTKREIV